LTHVDPPATATDPPRPAAAIGGIWRTLDELDRASDAEAVRQYVSEEFPVASMDVNWDDGVSRRKFLTLMGASLALAGVYGCSKEPDERIVPYVTPPEGVTAGRPLQFATAYTLGGFARGALVTSYEGRPTKVEGNPKHPASLGATDIFGQASLLGLYDPDRSQTVLRAGQPTSWGAFVAAMNKAVGALSQSRHGAATRASAATGPSTGQSPGTLRILTETITSPTLVAQIQAVLKQFPGSRWHQYEPVNRDNVYEGARVAFGRPFEPVYHLEKAKVIVSLDGDFLVDEPGSLKYARDFTNGRRIRASQQAIDTIVPVPRDQATRNLPIGTQMNRLYVAQTTPTLAGAKADLRLTVRPEAIEPLARELLDRVRRGGSESTTRAAGGPASGNAREQWLDRVAGELRATGGASVVIAGHAQPPAVHAVAHAINAELKNLGQTVTFIDPPAAPATAPDGQPITQAESLRQLVADIDNGDVAALLILDGNPAFTGPADLGFGPRLEALSRGMSGRPPAFTAHLSFYEDETSERCLWHVPLTHALEAWGDCRAFDGTASIIQPLISPLYASKTAHELLGAILGQLGRGPYELVRDYWRAQVKGEKFEEWWASALHEGVIPDSAFKPVETPNVNAAPAGAAAATQPSPGQGITLVFRPDPTIYDGRFANNPWLQELPKPFTKVTWDNPVLVSPATARRLGLARDDTASKGTGGPMVEVRVPGREPVKAAAWIVPGMPDDCAMVMFGYGRRRGGRVAEGTGFNFYPLRTSANLWTVGGATLKPLGEIYALATTQGSQRIEGDDYDRRDVIRVGHDPRRTHLAGGEEPARPSEPRKVSLSLFPEDPGQPGNSYKNSNLSQWGMVIDLTACIGCNACVVACVSENNIAVVGKEEVMRERQMYWLRIDTYYQGEPENPHALETYFQPVPCMHCEKAPCELVCPVEATSHSAEGLNEMTYNRCIGTRYCSNNCPYKVRRFNFFQYQDLTTPQLKLARNPKVTVRGKGVMEKCTYCVQRIDVARIDAKRTGHVGPGGKTVIPDGAVMTACQQACPTHAIVFGDINDAASEVAALKQEPHNYGLLEELNTQPRTTYLARLMNRQEKA